MRLLLAALLLAPALPAAAAKIDCPAAYKNYEADWAITRAEWDADCASGLKPDEILRKRQQDYMNACDAHYRPFLAKAKLEDWNLQVYCAQGAAGEAKLSTMTGAPPRRVPAPPPDAAPAVPLTPARRYYQSVDTLGSEWPKGWNDLPGGMLNNSMLRVFSGTSHAMYVNMAMNPARCVMAVNLNLHIESSCPPYGSNIMLIVDTGCTGRIETMRVTDEQKRALKCGQKKIDHIFAALDEAYTAGRAKIGK